MITAKNEKLTFVAVSELVIITKVEKERASICDDSVDRASDASSQNCDHYEVPWLELLRTYGEHLWYNLFITVWVQHRPSERPYEAVHILRKRNDLLIMNFR